MRPEHTESVLSKMHTGQWFGWSDSKNKVYANLIIYGDQEKPTQEFLESELARLQAEYDAEQIAKPQRLASAKSKLEALGLTVEEIKEAFGI